MDQNYLGLPGKLFGRGVPVEGPSERTEAGASQIHRTSPPAAKLGAGVEKSPGPSLFYGVVVFIGLAFVRSRIHSLKASGHGLNASVRVDPKHPLRGRGAGAASSSLVTRSICAVTPAAASVTRANSSQAQQPAPTM